MSVYNKSDIDYQKLISLLKNGGVFCYPTETLYGLGCLANNEEAIEKIYKIKQRDKEKNFTLIFKDLNMIEDLCSPTDIEKELISKFSPGPFSILLQAKEKSSINKKIISERNEICCRISSHKFVDNLFNFINIPIISTSANVSGNKNIFLFKTIYNTFHNLVDSIIDYGDIEKSLGSTIVKATERGLLIIRDGDLESKRIKDFYNGKSKGL